MVGLLLESRAKRQRRAGGATLSVAIHIAVIGAAMAGTATGRTAPNHKEPPVRLVNVIQPKHEPRPVRESSASTSNTIRDAIAPPVIVLPPTTVPNTLPDIDVSRGASIDSIVIAAPASAHDGRPGRTLGLDDDVPQSGAWGGTELLMRIVESRKPRYPESLRQAGIDGRVLVRFTVDTLGAVDMASVKVLESTHDLFTRSVRDVLGSFRFKPAEVHGKRVPSLAEMPFEFSISK